MVVFRHMWLCSDKSGCIRAKVVVLVQSGCIRAKWLFSGIVVVYRQGCYIWAKVVVFGQKWLYSGKVVVFGQSGCIQARLL